MDTQKIIQTLVYLASKQPDKRMNKMKAYKLMWLVDRYHLRQYGRTVTGDVYYALPHGVVPTDAKHLLEDKLTRLSSNKDMLDAYIRVDSDYVYSAIAEPDMDVFSQSDVEAMDKVLEAFGGDKVSPVVESMVLDRVCQIIPLTDKAIANLENQPVWKY